MSMMAVLLTLPVFAQLECPESLTLSGDRSRKIMLEFGKEITTDICNDFENQSPIMVSANDYADNYIVAACNPTANVTFLELSHFNCSIDCPGGIPDGNYTSIMLTFNDGTMMHFNAGGAPYNATAPVLAEKIDCLTPPRVPTLSEWGLAILALLLMIFGISYTRKSYLKNAVV